MDKKEYKPGETGVIEAELKTDHYYGKVTKNIMVTTDSIETPAVRLVLTVNVFAELRPLNTNLRFRNVVANKEYIKSIEIENNMNKPLEILGVKINDKMLRDKSYKVNANVEHKNGKDFINFTLVKTNLDYSFNNISIPITVYTNSKTVKELNFYAIVRLQKPIEIEPSSVYMYSTKIGNNRVKRITIKSNNGKPIKIINIDSTSQSIGFETAKESDFITHIWVGVKKTAFPGRLSGIISIKVENDNKVKTLKVPVRGTIVK